ILGAALQADGENEVRGDGLKHQKEKRSMDHFAGLDVSVKETSICIVDDAGRIVREVKVASEPAALLKALGKPTYRFKRIGLEAGPLSQWLFSALAEAGLPVVCVETRHMQAVLKAQINKTDCNDARGIAQMIRVGLYRPVHVKTLRSQKLRMLLTHRKLLQSKAIAIKFKAVNNRDKNFTRAKMERRMAQIEESVARYLEQLDTGDRQEPSEALQTKTNRLKEKIETLKQQMRRLERLKVEMLATPDQQISLTDPDARSMATSGRGSGVVGYNVQIAVEANHHLIVM